MKYVQTRKIFNMLLLELSHALNILLRFLLPPNLNWKFIKKITFTKKILLIDIQNIINRKLNTNSIANIKIIFILIKLNLE